MIYELKTTKLFESYHTNRTSKWNILVLYETNVSPRMNHNPNKVMILMLTDVVTCHMDNVYPDGLCDVYIFIFDVILRF